MVNRWRTRCSASTWPTSAPPSTCAAPAAAGFASDSPILRVPSIHRLYQAGCAARKLPRPGTAAAVLAGRGSVEDALETLDRFLGAGGGRLRARRGSLGPSRGSLGPRGRVIAVRPPGECHQQRSGGGRASSAEAHRSTLGGAR